MNEFIEKLMITSSKLAQSKFVNIIQNAFSRIMVITMVGGIAALLKGLSFGSYQAWLQSTPIYGALGAVYLFTVGLLAVYIAFFIGHSYASVNNLKGSELVIALMSLVCFFVVTPYELPSETINVEMIPGTWLGASGMFTAILTGLLVGSIFRFCKEKNIAIRLPDSVPPMIGSQFTALIPAFICTILFAALRIIFANTSFGCVHQVVYTLISSPLTKLGSNVFGSWIMTVVLYACWFFGIHGGMTVGPIIIMIFMPLGMANLEAYQAGQALPHIWIGKALSYGNGSLPLVIAALLLAKSEQIKSIAKLGVVPSFMGVDEPMYFGIPMIMNPVFFIPWVIICPTLSVFGTYLLELIGLLPYATGANAGGFVPFFFTNAVSFGWKGVFWGCVLMAACVISYIPFLKAYDRQKLEEEAVNQQKA